MRRPCNKKDAPQSSVGFGENIHKLKNSDKTTFYTPIGPRVMLAPTSKRPEEREFEVDPGTSMHMMSQKELSSDKLDTLRRSRNPTVVLTANGEVHTNQEAQAYVNDLNLFVTVQLLEETPAVLSLGKLCDDHGNSNEWVSGQKPRLPKEEKTIVYGQLRTSCRSTIHRRKHRHRRICRQQVQLKSEVTD